MSNMYLLDLADSGRTRSLVVCFRHWNLTLRTFGHHARSAAIVPGDVCAFCAPNNSDTPT